MVAALRSSTVALAIREMNSRPSIDRPLKFRPAWVGVPLIRKFSPLIASTVVAMAFS